MEMLRWRIEKEEQNKTKLELHKATKLRQCYHIHIYYLILPMLQSTPWEA